MNVLVVVHGFPPMAGGGSEIYAHAHARALVDQYGDRVCVLTREADHARPEYAIRREQRDGLDIAWINNTFRDVRSFAESYDNPAITRAAVQLIEEWRPEVAHVHHLTCLSTSIVHELKSRGVPVCMTLHDYWVMCHRGQLLDTALQPCEGPGPEGCAACVGAAAGIGGAGHAAAGGLRSLERHLPAGIASPLRQVAEQAARSIAGPDRARQAARARAEHMRDVCRRVSWFFTPSEDARRRFVRFGIPEDRISAVELGVGRSDRRSVRPADVAPNRPVRFGFLGSLMVSKAPHVLINAFRRLPPGRATLDVFGRVMPYHGDDGYRAVIEPLLETDGVRAHGPIAHERVAAALGDIDVLVVPSVWPETTGLVIKEAFLAGAVVIASRIGGMQEVVRDEVNGLLVPPGDEDALCRAMTRCLDDPSLLIRLRASAPAVRGIEADVAETRARLERLIASPPPASRVAAVVLNYGTPDDTLLAVRSLLASQPPLDEIVVVDNDEPGPCRAALAPLLGRVALVEAGANLGFSGGMNLGIRRVLDAGATDVLLVNSDVIVPPDCVAALRRASRATPSAGIVGPIVRSRSAPDVFASCGITYRPATGRMRQQDTGGASRSRLHGDLAMVDAVSGCLMLVKRDVFDAVGLLDEDFFFSFEDLEFCLRARRSGWRTALAGDATAYHEGGRSIGPASTRRLYFAARNHLLAAHRSAPESGVVASTFRSASIVSLNLLHAVRAPGASAPQRLAAVVRGTLDYASGRFGAAG